ncbi:hypothetical protein [Streptomyces sp. ISL-86]|uniref:hypothetical protein n=1 Tax=Streptomyces sp. ISL-86 TaxID=2819187 RepID=UPI001BE8383F|nr:hypothetical protein [Streptomyces sp. ISL-86]MBT2459036.1 hypothetical protein [Streptomyces sp. ISL-86]
MAGTTQEEWPSVSQHEQTVQILLTVEPRRIAEVLQIAQSLGWVTAAEYPEAGVLVGEVPESSLSSLAAIEGVLAVEREPTFGIA